MDMVFAKNLKKILTDRGMSVARLSRQTGIPAKTIYHWLGGQKPGDIEQLLRISEILQISLDRLLREHVSEKAKPRIQDFDEEINTGIFEVILRRVKK